jgi:hypothetical protein
MSKQELPKAPPQQPLLGRPVKVINIGLDRFAKELDDQGVPVVQVEWAPPAGGNAELARLLAKLGS